MPVQWFVLYLLLLLPFAMAAQSSSPARDASGQQLSHSDETFLKGLIQEDISEINLAQMALEKSEDPQVKQYAQSRIMAADPEMKDGAAKIAQEHGLQPPTGPGDRKQSVQDELAKKSGRLFDNAYMNYEATQQPDDLKLVDAEIGSTQNPEMKNYATAQKTPVEQAAKSAVELSRQISTSLTHYKQPDR